MLLLFSHSVVSYSLWPPWTVACHTSLSFTTSWSLLRLMSIELVMSSNQLILCCPSCSCFQSFWALGSFPMSWLFISGDQSIGASVLSLVFLMDIQDWFPLGLTHLISFQFQESPPTPQFKALILWCSAFFMVQLSHPYMIYWKNHSFDYMDLCWQSDDSAF